MIFTEGGYEPYMPAYGGEYDPKIAYSIGNRNIGLLFGQRARLSMLWKMNGYVSDNIVLIDDVDTEHLLTHIPNLKRLTFVFDHLSYPILAVQVPGGIEVYKFISYGGDDTYREHLVTIPGARDPFLIPTDVSDIGSVLNQPLLIYVDDVGDVVTRSYRDNFATVVDELVYGLNATDELREAGITSTGKIQIEISKIKQES